MKALIGKIPILGSAVRWAYRRLVLPFRPFPGSGDYWDARYKSGGTSGSGSYGRFAEFKADVLNGFVHDNEINTVIEYGCGDGNQLKLSRYPYYLGFDVSPQAVAQCILLFGNDKTKRFKLLNEYSGETAQLTLSLDVIYHLVEDGVFSSYMERLFDSSEEYVIIYSSNTNEQIGARVSHVRHRRFSTWIERERPEWKLVQHIPNKYPYHGDISEGSFADIFVYEKADRSRP